MEPQTFRETLVLTILEGLMLRHKEPGYSDDFAIDEAFRLSEKWCNGRAQNSESAESCQLPTTQVKSSADATAEQICLPCNGTGKRSKGDNLEYERTCAYCNGTGKRLLT